MSLVIYIHFSAQVSQVAESAERMAGVRRSEEDDRRFQRDRSTSRAHVEQRDEASPLEAYRGHDRAHLRRGKRKLYAAKHPRSSTTQEQRRY